MRRDVFVYISGPMTAKHGFSVEENTVAGAKAYFELLGHGIPAFCPHLSGLFPTAWSCMPWEDWLAYDCAVIDRCTHVLLLPRWETSTGALEERTYAEARGLPICLSVEALLLQVGDGRT